MELPKKTGVSNSKNEEKMLEFEQISRIPALKSNEAHKQLRAGSNRDFDNGYTINTVLSLQVHIDTKQYHRIPLKPDTTVMDIIDLVSKRRKFAKSEITVCVDNQKQEPHVNLYRLTAGGHKLVSIVVMCATDMSIDHPNSKDEINIGISRAITIRQAQKESDS
ncbi:hypothetical protein RFI_16645 [Reticulomyxa filosa]|uniref:Uncharacterized protein n=1 Tax=Reticulomyxa filosa TaxID=46433 RepID=X6N3T1_RETFI|nr:hypothetical protein RFI_16645 [Reticulomyxa filosa]|eukprot:ETO20573.1 hypothetical protein RFI_16645 [Reticulomyxa filosa]